MSSKSFEIETYNWRSFFNTVLICAVIGSIVPAFYYSKIATNQNSAQNKYFVQLAPTILSNASLVEGFIVSNFSAINTTLGGIQIEIQAIENILNMSENTAIMTINGVTANNATFNLDLENGGEMVITPDLANHRIVLESISSADVGVLENITSNDDSIGISGNTTITDLINNGVVDLNSATEIVILYAKDGLTISSNDSGILVCAPGINAALVDLVQQDANQEMQISALEVLISQQNTSITDLQATNAVIESLWNNTDMDFSVFNMTLLDLIMSANALQAQIVALQNQLSNLTGAATPLGTILPWSGTTATIPYGYLYCDGSEYDMGTYSDLFGILGTNFCGVGCSGGMFAVPDLRGRVPVGVGGTAFTVLGDQTVGQETHVVTLAELPDHFHGGNADSNGDHFHSAITNSETNHHHTVPLYGTTDGNQYSPAAYPLGGPCGASTVQMSSTKYMMGTTNLADIELSPNIAEICWQMYATSNSGTGHVHDVSVSTSGAHTHTLDIFSSGSSAAHNNIQPSVVVNYMIKSQ